MSTGEPFNLENGQVEFGMAFALLGLPADFQPSPTSPTVNFVNLQVSDGISVQPVPEPSIIIGITTAIGFAGLFKKRKINKKF